jgi:hypothetical protein
MKKIFVFLLAFLYITSSCEATVYLHYCMGKAVSFSFFAGNSLNCHRCGMKKSGKGMSCCRDEQKLVKSDKSQKLADFPSFSIQKKFNTSLVTYTIYSFYRQPSSVNRLPFHGPPGDNPVPLFLMNRLLLI